MKLLWVSRAMVKCVLFWRPPRAFLTSNTQDDTPFLALHVLCEHHCLTIFYLHLNSFFTIYILELVYYLADFHKAFSYLFNFGYPSSCLCLLSCLPCSHPQLKLQPQYSLLLLYHSHSTFPSNYIFNWLVRYKVSMWLFQTPFFGAPHFPHSSIPSLSAPSIPQLHLFCTILSSLRSFSAIFLTLTPLLVSWFTLVLQVKCTKEKNWSRDPLRIHSICLSGSEYNCFQFLLFRFIFLIAE